MGSRGRPALVTGLISSGRARGPSLIQLSARPPLRVPTACLPLSRLPCLGPSAEPFARRRRVLLTSRKHTSSPTASAGAHTVLSSSRLISPRSATALPLLPSPTPNEPSQVPGGVVSVNSEMSPSTSSKSVFLVSSFRSLSWRRRSYIANVRSSPTPVMLHSAHICMTSISPSRKEYLFYDRSSTPAECWSYTIINPSLAPPSPSVSPQSL